MPQKQFCIIQNQALNFVHLSPVYRRARGPSWPQQNAACLLERWWLCYDLAHCLFWLHTPFITSALSAHPGVKHKEGRNNWKEKQLVVSNEGTNKASHYSNNNITGQSKRWSAVASNCPAILVTFNQLCGDNLISTYLCAERHLSILL